MRIGIFVEAVKAMQQTGISRYTLKLVETLVKQRPKGVTFFLYYQHRLSDPRLTWLRNEVNVRHRPILTPVDLLGEHPTIFWNWYLPIILSIDKISVFHGPNHFIPLSGNVPSIVTIHDIAFFFMTVHGSGFDAMLKNWTLKSIEKAAHVVTVSKSTAKDIKNKGCDQRKVSVIYQGYEPNPQASENKYANRNRSEHRPYLLFIGTVQPRKNVKYMIEEYASVCADIAHQLVIAGAPGDSQFEAERIVETHNLKERVTFTGFISDEERHDLYSSADAFLYPSLYEGFGLVVLEAMSYGVPVITANNSALPESGGDAAYLVDVDKKGALATAILHVIRDEGLRCRMIERGFAHSQSFDWESSAHKMMDLYQSVSAARTDN